MPATTQLALPNQHAVALTGRYTNLAPLSLERGYMITVVLGLLLLVIFFLPLISKTTHKPLEWHVSPEHKKKVHEHAQSVLDSQCRPGSTRQRLLARLPASSHRTQPFLWKNMPLPDELFQYPPPFGFKGHQGRVEDLLKLLPNSDDTSQMKKTERCQRCMVVGNGGILRGLELGPLINHFDTIIRLNSGPLEGFSVDVGNRTSIRMSYPEGTPHPWVDRDPHTLFVGVTYKRVDINWMSAMISKNAVSLWDRLFFWKSIPDQVPVKPHRFRLLNPQVIEETAFYLLKYPAPTSRLWGSDQNVPTLGVSALNLASLLCDEVSLAGFGYNFSDHRMPLHYHDSMPMSAMLQQYMHNVDKETELLRILVKDGTITDVSGGIYCSFCTS
uniref:lactosylceramide alpha-2,3-sialyltransferase isoform X2 n=1 Tax=Monopterus albus TaxID=43700 RepID=UPI0009B39718|nr:lactosylceramide alpha-2,3-sialyltransferase isoform X2 [Monopterus albus]